MRVVRRRCTSIALLQASGPAPIVDQRRSQGWIQQLPARVGTGGLWLSAGLALGPAKLIPLGIVGVVLAPLLLLDRPRGGATPSMALPPAPMVRDLPRVTLAERLGLAEAQLFRGRHAAICSVYHDAEGRIVELRFPAPRPPFTSPTPDAHCVG